MKRRMFLSSAGTVGIVGAASGGTSIVSSAYSSLSSSEALAAFSPANKTILDKFVAQLTQNFQEFDSGKELVNKIALPLRIIKNDNQNFVYKNIAGDYVSFVVENEVERIHISDKW